VFLVSLLLLIVNDHYLKAAHPSFLTGKLSDVSGLLVFAFVACALLSPRMNSRQRLAGLHVAIAAAFVLWKLAPVELILDRLGEITTLPMPSRVKDASDLLALGVLPLSYFLIRRPQTQVAGLASMTRRRCASALAVLLVGSWAIIATPARIYTVEIRPEKPLRTSVPNAQVLYQVEKSLLSNYYVIDARELIDSTTYRFYITGTRYWGSHGWLDLKQDSLPGTWSVQAVLYSGNPDGEEVREIFTRETLNPMLREVSGFED